VLCTSSAATLAGCGLAAAIDHLGSVGSGGGVERLRDSGADAIIESEDGGAESGDALSDADGAAADALIDADSEAADATDAPIEGDSPATGAIGVEADIVLEQPMTVACPGISDFSVSPTAIALGQQAQLTVVTVGPPAAIQWSVSPASGGKVSNAMALAPTFECAVAEPVTVAVTIGPLDGASCTGVPFTSYAVLIDCQK
jgi:hypothetical protein